MERRDFTFTWEVENFLPYFEDAIFSPEFIADNLCRSSWYMSIEIDADDISVFLHRNEDDKEEKISIDFTIEAEVRHEIITFEEKKNCNFSKSLTHGCKSFLKLSDLVSMQGNTLLVRCCMSKTISVAGSQPSTGSKAKTRFAHDMCHFLWDVSFLDTPDWKASREFPLPDMCYIEIKLSAPENDILVEIRRKIKSPCPRQHLACKMSLLEENRTVHVTRKAKQLFSCEQDALVWKFPTFITKKELADESNSFLKNGMFTLLCEFSLSTGIAVHENGAKSLTISSQFPSQSLDTFKALCENLQSMLTDQKYCDVKLKVDGEEYLAHKSFLAARSPRFSRIFSERTADGTVDTVPVVDMDSNTCKYFLEFLYTGKVKDMSPENALKLLDVGHKYEVASLVDGSVSFLISKLSPENACEILQQADVFKHGVLTTSVYNYMIVNRSAILASQGWEDLIEADIKLATKVMQSMSKFISDNF